MDTRTAGIALASVVLAGLGAGPALASPGVTVGSVSSLQRPRAGTVRGAVINRTDHAVDAKVRVRIQRYGAAARFLGNTAVRVRSQRHGGVLGRGQGPERPQPGQLLPGGVHDASGADLGCATSAKRHPDQGRHADPGRGRAAARRQHRRAGGAGGALRLGRAHARPDR